MEEAGGGWPSARLDCTEITDFEKEMDALIKMHIKTLSARRNTSLAELIHHARKIAHAARIPGSPSTRCLSSNGASRRRAARVFWQPGGC